MSERSGYQIGGYTKTPQNGLDGKGSFDPGGFLSTEQFKGAPPIKITTDQSTLQAVGIALTFAVGSLTVNWMDGSLAENFVSGVELTHNYSVQSSYDIEISGNFECITKFIADNSRITFIEDLRTGLLTEFDINGNLYVGVLDMLLAPISVKFWAYSNSGLTGIIFANSGNQLVSNFIVRLCDLTGNLNVSNVPVENVFEVHTNPNLIGVSFASSENGTLTGFRGQLCNFTGDFDLSNITVGGLFFIQSNPNLTGFIFATSGNSIFTNFDASNCDITGIPDFSNNPISGAFRIFSNPNMTNIIFATSGNALMTSAFYGYNCDITGVLDVSNIPISANFIWRFNPNLTNVLFSATGNGAAGLFDNDNCSLQDLDFSNFTNSTPTIEMDNNSMSAAEHDNQLINLNGTGWINGALDILTGNTARTSASDVAYNNLIANDWNIT